MPPNGFQVVTVPQATADALDSIVEQTEASNRSEAVQHLVDGHEPTSEMADLAVIAERLGHIQDEVQHLPERTADEVEGRLR